MTTAMREVLGTEDGVEYYSEFDRLSKRMSRRAEKWLDRLALTDPEYVEIDEERSRPMTLTELERFTGGANWRIYKIKYRLSGVIGDVVGWSDPDREPPHDIAAEFRDRFFVSPERIAFVAGIREKYGPEKHRLDEDEQLEYRDICMGVYFEMIDGSVLVAQE